MDSRVSARSHHESRKAQRRSVFQLHNSRNVAHTIYSERTSPYKFSVPLLQSRKIRLGENGQEGRDRRTLVQSLWAAVSDWN